MTQLCYKSTVFTALSLHSSSFSINEGWERIYYEIITRTQAVLTHPPLHSNSSSVKYRWGHINYMYTCTVLTPPFLHSSSFSITEGLGAYYDYS